MTRLQTCSFNAQFDPRLVAAFILLFSGCASGVGGSHERKVQSGLAISLETPKDGHYSIKYNRTSNGGCSVTSFASTLHSQVVVDIGTNLRITACRQFDFRSETWPTASEYGEGVFASDPHLVHHTERQGYSGSGQRDGQWIVATLNPDDSVCSPMGDSDSRPQPWTLECVWLAGSAPERPSGGAADDSLLPPPNVLACFHDATKWPRSAGYSIELAMGRSPVISMGARTGEWLLLGRERELQIDDHAFGGLHPIPNRRWSTSVTANEGAFHKP